MRWDSSDLLLCRRAPEPDLGTRSIGWRAGAEPSPKPDCPVNGALEGIVLNDPLPGGQAERAALIWVSEQGVNRSGQGLGVLDRDKLPRSFQRGAAGHAGGHNGRSAGHGFEQDQGHPVVAGRDHDNIGRAQIRRRIRTKTNQLDAAGEAQGADLVLDSRPVLALISASAATATSGARA